MHGSCASCWTAARPAPRHLDAHLAALAIEHGATLESRDPTSGGSRGFAGKIRCGLRPRSGERLAVPPPGRSYGTRTERSTRPQRGPRAPRWPPPAAARVSTRWSTRRRAGEVQVDGVADVVRHEAARAQHGSSRQKISAARTLNGSSAAPMSTTRPPGPPIAMACSSTRRRPRTGCTTSGPAPPSAVAHRCHRAPSPAATTSSAPSRRRSSCLRSERVTAMTRAPRPCPAAPRSSRGRRRRARRASRPAAACAIRLRPWSGVATASVSTARTPGRTGAGGATRAAAGRTTYSAKAPSTSTPMRVMWGLMLGRPRPPSGHPAAS